MMGGLFLCNRFGPHPTYAIFKNSLKTKQETGYIGNGEQL